MARNARLLGFLIVLVALTAAGQTAQKNFRAELTSFQEVPSLSTSGVGTIHIRISPDESALHFVLSYSGLEGAVSVAHIHLGATATTGGVIAFFCGGGGRPACPQSGTVEGTITAADVIGPAAQGIEAGEFEEVVRALRHDAVYANVHSDIYPTGEIRGQLRADRGN